MTKRFAIFFAVVLMTITLWSLFIDHPSITILMNGKEISGPIKEAANIGGIIVALIALIGLAILMALAFASVWVLGFRFWDIGNGLCDFHSSVIPIFIAAPNPNKFSLAFYRFNKSKNLGYFYQKSFMLNRGIRNACEGLF